MIIIEINECTFIYISGLQALALKAQYETSPSDAVVDQIKSLLGSNSGDASVQVTASHVLLVAGQTKEALQCVHGGTTMEQMAMALQIYLKIDRLDLAQSQLRKLRQHDEDSVLAQLGSVYVMLATGSTAAADAVHVLHSLSEQYGPSPLLLNLMACALMQQGDYDGASQKLEECLRDHAEISLPDTLINMIACTVQLNNSPDQYLQQIRQQYPNHVFCQGLDRVTQAFDREAVKYKV